MEIIILIVPVFVFVLCFFFYCRSITVFARVRAISYYSHYQSLSLALDKFPLDAPTDYLEVVISTLCEAAQNINGLPSDRESNEEVALDIILVASSLATRHGQIMAFPHVVQAAVLLDLKAKRGKFPSKFLAYLSALGITSIIPPNF